MTLRFLRIRLALLLLAPLYWLLRSEKGLAYWTLALLLAWALVTVFVALAPLGFGP